MKIYKLKKEQLIKKNILEVFDFFSKPENLAVLTPAKMQFNILTPSPIEMKSGALIDYTVKVLGIPIRWTTYISKYEPPNMFVDQQLKGPYSLWHHTHIFKKINNHETMMEDIVLYGIPFGFLGVIAHEMYVKHDLEKIFLYRNKKINEVFKNIK